MSTVVCQFYYYAGEGAVGENPLPTCRALVEFDALSRSCRWSDDRSFPIARSHVLKSDAVQVHVFYSIPESDVQGWQDDLNRARQCPYVDGYTTATIYENMPETWWASIASL